MGSNSVEKSVHDFGSSVVENSGELIIKDSEFKNNSTEHSGAVLNNSGSHLLDKAPTAPLLKCLTPPDVP